jgi:hypothetical protein
MALYTQDLGSNEDDSGALGANTLLLQRRMGRELLEGRSRSAGSVYRALPMLPSHSTPQGDESFAGEHLGAGKYTNPVAARPFRPKAY